MIATNDTFADREHCPYCCGTYSCTSSATATLPTCTCRVHYTVTFTSVDDAEPADDKHEDRHNPLAIDGLRLLRFLTRLWRRDKRNTSHAITTDEATLSRFVIRNRGPPGDPFSHAILKAATDASEVAEGGVVLFRVGHFRLWKDWNHDVRQETDRGAS